MPVDVAPSVSVIVLNYNGLTDLGPCLSSLVGLDYPRSKREILVVDNASSDGSADWVKGNRPEVRLIANTVNRGFAGGIASGVAVAEGEYIAFLNADMRVEPAWLRELTRAVASRGGIACAGSVILNWEGTHIDYAGRPQDALNLCPQPPEAVRAADLSRERQSLLFASGGAMLIARKVFLDLGGFDPDYFLYHEDVDLGWRLWIKGLEVVRATSSVVFHRGGRSARTIPPAQVMGMAQKYALYTVLKDLQDERLWPILPEIVWFMVERTKWFDSARESLDPAVRGLISEVGRLWRKRQGVQGGRVRDDVDIFKQCGDPFGFLHSHPAAAEFRENLTRCGEDLTVPAESARELGTRLERLLQFAHKFNRGESLAQGTPGTKTTPTTDEPCAGQAARPLSAVRSAPRKADTLALLGWTETLARRCLSDKVRSRLAPSWQALKRMLASGRGGGRNR